MFKKLATSLGVAAVLLLVSATPALATTYPPDNGIISEGAGSDAPIVPGQSIPITFSGIPETLVPNGGTVAFEVSGAGASLASIVRTAASTRVLKTVVDGSATATFTSNTEGSFTVSLIKPPNQVIATRTVVVAIPADASGGAGAAAGGSTGGLPATGGALPAAVVWLGVGAVGVGGIALAAGIARRRANTSQR